MMFFPFDFFGQEWRYFQKVLLISKRKEDLKAAVAAGNHDSWLQ